MRKLLNNGHITGFRAFANLITSLAPNTQTQKSACLRFGSCTDKLDGVTHQTHPTDLEGHFRKIARPPALVRQINKIRTQCAGVAVAAQSGPCPQNHPTHPEGHVRKLAQSLVQGPSPHWHIDDVAGTGVAIAF